MIGNQKWQSCSTPSMWSDCGINMISYGNLFHGQINCWKKSVWFQQGLVISLRSTLHLNIKQAAIHLFCCCGPFFNPSSLSARAGTKLCSQIEFKHTLVYWWADIISLQRSFDTVGDSYCWFVMLWYFNQKKMQDCQNYYYYGPVFAGITCSFWVAQNSTGIKSSSL